MTLINYLNRVHFAENVLEEALWAELDRRTGQTAFLLSTTNGFDSDLGERLKAGLPKKMRIVTCNVSGDIPSEAEARQVASRFAGQGGGVLVAFGRGYVINLAKAARLLASHDTRLARFAESEGGAARITRPLPDLIAVPTLQGFVAGFNGLAAIRLDDGTMIDLASPVLAPTVTIGDPSVALSEPVSVQAGSGVEAVTLCIEALLSPNYNPPANGIALDGLNRGLQALSSLSNRPDPAARRELMAACMNAALVQQKGLGLAHAITGSLCAESEMPLNKPAIKRLLLPRLLDFYALNGALARSPLMDAMGFTNPCDTVKAISRTLRDLPLPATLSDLGITADLVARASARAARHRVLSNSPCRPVLADIQTLLTAIL